MEKPLDEREKNAPGADVFDTEEITPVLLRALTERIVRALNPEKVILYGSRARGDAHARSDLDLLVVMETEESPFQRGSRVSILIHPRAFDLDVKVYTPEEFEKAAGHDDYWYDPFIKEVLKDGKVLYDKQAA